MRLLIGLSILTGLIYPLVITGISAVFFHAKAEGSLVYSNGKPVGSELIGQYFGSPAYFWGRPSATNSFPYNPQYSSGSNLGPTNPLQAQLVEGRIKALKKMDLANNSSVPIDLVTASGSGLDPHISVLAAQYQAQRVASARSLPLQKVYELIEENTEGRQLGIFGEPRVNVLLLNLALDKIQ